MSTNAQQETPMQRLRREELERLRRRAGLPVKEQGLSPAQRSLSA